MDVSRVAVSNDSFHISQRLSYSNHLCTVRYIGPVNGTSGTWLGVEWDNPANGKHSGTHSGIEYFTCLSSSPTAASFIRPSRPREQSQSFLSALRGKYVAEAGVFLPGPRNQIFFNGKLAEEVGFEKVAAQQAALGELRIVVLDGLRVAGLKDDGNLELEAGAEWQDLIREIRTTAGNITELDLSRNLLERWADIAGICMGLPRLRKLVLDGNRFSTGFARSDAGFSEIHIPFQNINELSIEGTLLTWEQINSTLKLFPSLQTLSLAANNLSSSLTNLPTPCITSLNLSFNPLSSFLTIADFSSLQNLTTLTLRSCQISSLPALPSPFTRLQHLDISSNSIPNLAELNSISTSFPGLQSFRCSSNPFYSNLPVEEAHMLTLSRIPSINMLNYSRISDKERENAELYYLSKIRTEISKGIELNRIRNQHPLFELLATEHGQAEEFAAAAREKLDHEMRDEDGLLIKEGSLASRLVRLDFHIAGTSIAPTNPAKPSPSIHHTSSATPQTPALTLTLPKPTSIYRLYSLVGRQLNISPMEIRLIWETGELDPVARNLSKPGRIGEGIRIAEAESDDESDDGDEKESGAARERRVEEQVKWMKREVELDASTRPIGYWIEGRRAAVRIEILSQSPAEQQVD